MFYSVVTNRRQASLNIIYGGGVGVWGGVGAEEGVGGVLDFRERGVGVVS